MAPLRTAQSRTRPSRPHKVVETFEDSLENELAAILDEEPPRKRIRTSRKSNTRSRWIPGGRGGGGRHVDVNDPEYAAFVAAQKEAESKGPRRPRAGRQSQKSMTATPRISARARSARGGARPRYSTAAAASAAVAHGDGYKPREERGWEEFHPDLDLDSNFAVLESQEVDGLKRSEGLNGLEALENDDLGEFGGALTPSRRRAGRPQRRGDSMLNSLLTPEPPKFVPVPAPNPRERLTLPKPSYRELDPFLVYEQKEIAALNFVDKTMASVGYQEGEIYLRPERRLVRQMEGSAEEDLDLSPALAVEGENSAIGSSGVGRVEYDMDEQDVKWLEALNKIRTKDGVGIIKPAVFEITMTKIEKEWHALEKRIPKPNPKAPQTQRPRSSSAAAVNGEPGSGEEPDSKCAICDDGDCENANAIVFCDGCDLAVHQECYGVPYIPEGQWLCRKCQLVGSARPSCIFCPNEGGAFKQTNNSKWAHLFCANWIPEVNIGNPSLMEPITDVEKVPPGRWKLECYICRQRMGASIQCSHQSCYDAFHLTCARQAGLYLRMKSGGGTNTLMDPAQLRAYCHKHAPAEWKADHNTDTAISEAMSYFKKQFKNQVWADSRASALAVSDVQPSAEGSESGLQRIVLTNKKGQKQKIIWRLPSGAPVIPEVLLKSIEDSLVRFLVQKKKDYVAEVCKYWTLKREARRGAALLKRLQLQMDTFSSFEVTRRDYKAQGSTGRARLERRITFAETLAKDLERIRAMCEAVKRREAEKLEEAAMLRQIVDTVYFPVPPLLWPILDKAFRHDTRNVYHVGLLNIRSKLVDRAYTSVTPFSADLAHVFAMDLGLEATSTADLQAQIFGPAGNLTSEQKERRTMARRLVKTLQPLLEEALRKEGELTGRPYAQQIKEMDEMIFSRRPSLTESVEVEESSGADQTPLVNGIDNSTPGMSGTDMDVEMQDAPVRKPAVEYINGHAFPIDPPSTEVEMLDSEVAGPRHLTNGDVESGNTGNMVHGIEETVTNTPPASMNGLRKDTEPNSEQIKKRESEVHEPPTPPMSLGGTGAAVTLSHGGIPWYVEAFDPVGTTILDERWTGPEVLRGMSEELSEMDEDELTGLGVEDLDDTENNPPPAAKNGDGNGNGLLAPPPATSPNKKKMAKKAPKKRGQDWGGRSFRTRRVWA